MHLLKDINLVQGIIMTIQHWHDRWLDSQNIGMTNSLTHKTLGPLNARVKQPYPKAAKQLKAAAVQPTFDDALNKWLCLYQNSEVDTIVDTV